MSRNKNKLIKMLATILVLAALSLYMQYNTRLHPGSSPSGMVKATVIKHVDGDTFYVQIDSSEYKVRLIGVDCPESTTRTEPYGKEASEYTRRMLLNKPVWLEKDAGDTDKYGRLLRYVWLEEPRDRSADEIKAKMFNAVLVAEGYAQVMTVPPNVKYQEQFVALQRSAHENGVGLWSADFANKKTEGSEQQTISDLVGNRNSRKFHKPSCKYSKDISEANRVSFKTRQEAVDSGYAPCKTCNP